jgi:hypothetical protein
VEFCFDATKKPDCGPESRSRRCLRGTFSKTESVTVVRGVATTVALPHSGFVELQPKLPVPLLIDIILVPLQWFVRGAV